MKRIFYFLACLLLIAKTANAGTCEQNTDALDVATYASKSIVSLTLSRITPDEQAKRMEDLLTSCVDVGKVSRRVLGRAKWEELTKEQQDNFLKEYPQYFFYTFKDIILSALSSTSNVTVKQTSIENIYEATFVTAGNPIKINLTLEQRGGFYKIVDGSYQNVSVVETQRNTFDMLYEKDTNSIKNFKAEKYMPKK